ncbi:GNAT family N-acetyltransferase [Flavobacterium sp. HXWNR29]|uniref:GNAT family N-acetyltransferase n=1 Tax=Flavobacterium odoriferum TaxID=2946604 RepID=UPI0021CB6093|nr:GNAT family N-acetyltransferase [Flavobacterium sp. HXWNR29]MCU4189519.1 GNAT family N-acetyltransferase [Flavobacterium sp. HXWNR29]
MITREASINDWDKLFIFFNKIYRKNHPLQNKEFWEWQYGNPKFGRSFICLNENNEVVGHVGANFGGNVAWVINVYLEEECRGKGILSRLYELARAYYPLAATAANEAGLGLYRNMRWYRYYDLVRYVKINPKFNIPSFEKVCSPCEVEVNNYLKKDTHFFQQPGIKGLLFENGSRAVSQSEVGGLRVVDILNLNELENTAWRLGYNWMDYITSWNDLKNKDLEKEGWVIDSKSIIPWRLNPIEKGYFCDITFLSEEPLSREFVVHRSFSDHGRVGSL